MPEKPLSALILEDCEDDALLVVRELGKQGFEVTWERAWTASAMKAALAANSWQVVLSDYSMPGFDAPAALRLLQESGQEDLPFIVVSGTVGEEAAVAAMQNGAHDYLMKGKLARLGAAIERELREAENRRERRLAIDKVQHLNRVLRAIRNVTQLIVREKDPIRLIEGGCECLVETRGYDAAWIALLDEHRKPTKIAGRGYQDEWSDLRASLQRGEMPRCALEALASPAAVFVDGQVVACRDCVVHKRLGFHKTLTIRIAHQGRVYGVMAVTLLGEVPIDDSETSLFEEVAGDLGFALWSIEAEAERKQGAHALELERDFNKALFETARAIVLVLDTEGRVVLFNPYLEELSGYTLEELRGADWFETFLPEERRTGTRELFGRAVAGAPTRGNIDVLHTRDGRELLIEWHDSVLKDGHGQTTRLLCMGQDVTARQQAEERLKESEQYLASIIDEIGDPVFVKDASSHFVLVNKAMCTLLGKSPQELIGTTGAEFLPADEMEHFFAVDRAVESSGIGNISEEQLTTPDGAVRTIVTRKTRWVDHEDARFIVGVIRDMTEIKQMQAQLAQSDRLAQMGMLAAGVAHEINSPLTYVLYNLESLTDHLPKLAGALSKCQGVVAQRLGPDEWTTLMGSEKELLEPALLDDVGARFKDALQGAHLIKDVARGLGTFSRVDQDRTVPVNLMQAIEVAITMVQNEIRFRARLVKEYGTTAATMANDGKLSQVFLNLLINAAHSIPEGDFDGNEIRVRTWQEGGEVLAEVRDSGAGISSRNLPRLFEPFFTTKAIGVGTGLGLPISRNIIEGYGGRIDVTSAVGVGTSFVVRLPVADKSAQVGEKPPAAPSPELRTEVRGRILVIDDEAGIRAAMKRMLKGHEVVEAASGDKGRRLLERDRAFDLILCDMMMPGVSGVELHQWLVATYPDLAERLVFITGGAFTPSARDYLTRVSNLRMEKPFVVADFKRTVNDRIRQVKASANPA